MDNRSISLLAKWLKSENTSSLESRKIANKIRVYLGWTPKQYRKTLSALREYLKIVEKSMSANKWSDINYSGVPSKAGLNYRKAFFKHDKERYEEFLSDVKVGKVKINADTLFPYEIVRKVLKGELEDTLNVLWDNLPNYMEDNTRNILAVVDVSGSMLSSDGLPMAVSISLGIYTAERNKGPFSGYYITYSREPVLQKVIGNSLLEKVGNMQENPAYNTDLQKVFDMLLETATKNKITESDMPEQILVITDCEFDNPQNGKTNLESIKDKYSVVGYKIPQLVFWNVNSKQNNVPATANEKGVLLVSGSSPSVFKTLLLGKQYTPVDQMLETLNQSIYDKILV